MRSLPCGPPGSGIATSSRRTDELCPIMPRNCGRGICIGPHRKGCSGARQCRTRFAVVVFVLRWPVAVAKVDHHFDATGALRSPHRIAYRSRGDGSGPETTAERVGTVDDVCFRPASMRPARKPSMSIMALRTRGSRAPIYAAKGAVSRGLTRVPVIS
jgi:hypothetical protein